MRRAAIVGALAFALAGCGSGDEDAGGGGGGEETGRYPEAVRKNFLDSCDAQPNARRRTCECTLEYLEKRVTLEEFEEIDRKLTEGGKAPKVLQDSVDACTR
jgi:hypothetical protein